MTKTINSILVPTDGSEGARVAARRGIDLAQTTDADLHVLSVVDTREVEPSLSSPDSDVRSEREQLREKNAEDAVDAVSRLAMPTLSGRVTTAVERGVPFRSITEYADTHGIDLIVMGTEGRTGLERVLIGSVAEKTLRTASVPVVIVPPDAGVAEFGTDTYEEILLPTDGSEGAEIAVEWGITLAELHDATVHTIYSVDTSRVSVLGEVPEVHDALEEIGREALESVRERATDAGVSVVANIGSGPAARMILTYSEEHDTDMIVIGTHGRSGVERYLLGSVTETVVRESDVPICCVPMKGL